MAANKFGAKPVIIDGQRFASIAEGKRYQELRLMERGGLIRNLETQPKFDLIVNGVKIGVYRADFKYLDLQTMECVTEDVKGVMTREFKRTKRLVFALYGIDVRVIT